jgi:hypothetical protein
MITRPYWAFLPRQPNTLLKNIGRIMKRTTAARRALYKYTSPHN